MTVLYKKLETIFEKLSHLEHIQAIAGWDEAVMMPKGGGNARARALTTIKSIHHSTLTNPEIGKMLAAAQHECHDTWQSKNLAWMDKQYQRAAALPARLVATLTQANLRTEQAWRTLRADNNWQDFAPLLDENVRLARESADIRAEKFNKLPYDVLLDDFSPDLNQKTIDPIFHRLKNKLPPLIEKIVEKQEKYSVIELIGPFEIKKQKQLGLELMKALGFDFNHGRLDISHHPFCGGVPQDVRITTRYNTDEFITAAMGTCHETGHARYEQNLPNKWIDQPVGRAQSMLIHESQSLIVEMQACRSKSFIQFIIPLLKRYFGDQKGFTEDNLHRLYTKVKPGLIRVDADEVTYPLHIIIRYEIEKALFNKEIEVVDLPSIWQEMMTKLLNITTANNFKDGIMQDVHWPAGLFGYFPAYTLGSLMAAQLFYRIQWCYPNIHDDFSQGNFETLFAWLKKHIHQRASSVSFDVLLRDATKSELDEKFFLQHIEKRYCLG